MRSAGRFDGKTALVTGAASGIGLAVARLLADEGAVVIRADLLNEADPFDVSKEEDWERLRESGSGLDILVACAGISHAAPLESMPLKEWRRVMQVNLDGQFLGLRYALRAVRSGGSVVVVGSASGVKPSAGASAYCTSKSALRMLVKSAALEAKPKGIRINMVSPAGVVTPMWKSMEFWKDLAEKHGEAGAWDALGGADPASDPLARMAFPEEIARVIAWMASAESGNMTGAEIAVDAGYTIR